LGGSKKRKNLLPNRKIDPSVETARRYFHVMGKGKGKIAPRRRRKKKRNAYYWKVAIKGRVVEKGGEERFGRSLITREGEKRGGKMFIDP